VGVPLQAARRDEALGRRGQVSQHVTAAEGDLRNAFEFEAVSDGDVRMKDEFWHTLYAASKVVLPVACSEKLQEELWGIRKSRSKSLAEHSKRFRCSRAAVALA
jgi:hypothetical protein